MPFGVGGSCRGVAPGASGASEAELLGGPPGADGDRPGDDRNRPGVVGDCPGVTGDCSDGETGAGVTVVVGLPGGAPVCGEALLLSLGEVTRLPACAEGLGLGLGLVSPESGGAVGDGVDAALVPVGGDASGAGDALGPGEVGEDAPELLG